MKIPFDIKFRPQIESGEYKVETRDGKPARIICWDKKEYKDQREQPTPIVYLITSKGGCEHIMSCTTAGMYSDGLERDSDLFLTAPEPEFTEFEKRLWEIMKSEGSPIGPMDKFTQDDERVFHAYSNQLLVLARKEIMKEWSNGLNDTQERSGKAYNDGYELGLLQGKTEALKYLPRWKKCDFQMGTENPFPRYLVRTGGAHYSLTSTILKCDEYIPLSELAKLPKED